MVRRFADVCRRRGPKVNAGKIKETTHVNIFKIVMVLNGEEVFV